MPPFTQYKQWMIERYGDALFRVPVQLASSCPHGRCAFCSENGSKAQQTQRHESPQEQIEAAIRFSKRRYKAQKLMLYIQAFTADLTDPAQQKEIVQALEKYHFTAISIGTRPDCLPPEALDFLQRLQVVGQASLYSESLCLSDPPKNTRSRVREACPTNIDVSPDQPRFEVWVEPGVQTANDETLKRINRGHDWACSKNAILKLAERGIHVAPHVIIGLPGETADDWNRTASELAALPLSGIKIHNLHIMKGTEFANTRPPTMNHWEYAEALMDFLRRIPADIPVMRISTDTPDDERIAPHWHLEKGQFLDYVIQQMTCRQISQGDLLETGNLKFETGMVPVATDDGSITFFSNDWKEHYHTKSGARLEAEKKFVEPSGLAEKLQTRDVKLLDVCFGLGNNSLAALCAAKTHRLDITALEMDKRVVRAASQFFQPLNPSVAREASLLRGSDRRERQTDPVNWQEVLKKLCTNATCHLPLATLSLLWGDARYLIRQIPDNAMDVVFHDPFSSQHCPELWTVEFFQQLYRVMKPDGVLLTYSSALPVRGAMREAGFLIGETRPGHPLGNGTIAAKTEFPRVGKAGGTSAVRFPMVGIYDANGVKPDERRSIPYRDPHLCATSKAILRNRQEAVEERAAER